MSKEKSQREANLNYSQVVASRLREPKGQPIGQHVRTIVNSVIQAFVERGLDLNVYRQTNIRLLPDIEFDNLRTLMYSATIHPFATNTLVNMIKSRQTEESDDEVLGKSVDIITAGYGRSANLYIRRSAVDVEAQVQQFTPKLREEARPMLESVLLSARLIEYGVFLSAKVRQVPIDNPYKAQFVNPILRADAARQIVLTRDQKEEYVAKVYEYVKGKPLVVICQGARAALEVERKFIAVAQLQFDQLLLSHLCYPMLTELIGRLRKKSDIFARMTKSTEVAEVIRKYYPHTEITPQQDEYIEEVLQVLSGFVYEEQLGLYLSGRYFENHLLVLPGQDFLP